MLNLTAIIEDARRRVASQIITQSWGKARLERHGEVWHIVVPDADWLAATGRTHDEAKAAGEIAVRRVLAWCKSAPIF